jgi:hypothetical protein
VRLYGVDAQIQQRRHLFIGLAPRQKLQYAGGEMKNTALLALFVLALVSCSSNRAHDRSAPQPLPANEGVQKSMEQDRKEVMGQTIYVPIYSHIYIRDKSRALNLAATLSIRNTDKRNPIRITSAQYFNTEGKLIKEYATSPLVIAPMASTEIVIAESDTSGGSGASFVVEWSSGFHVMDPISAAGQQGISFVSTGRVIKNRTPQ